MRRDDVDGLRDLRRDVRVASWVLLPTLSVLTAGASFAVATGLGPGDRAVLAVFDGLAGLARWPPEALGQLPPEVGHVRLASLMESSARWSPGRELSGSPARPACCSRPPTPVAERGGGGPGAQLRPPGRPGTWVGHRRMARGGRAPCHCGCRSDGRGPALAVRQQPAERIPQRRRRGLARSAASQPCGRLDVRRRATPRVAARRPARGDRARALARDLTPGRAGRRRPRATAAVRRDGWAVIVFTAIGWIPMLLVPAPLLDRVYGPGFADGWPVLVLLTLGSLGAVVAGLGGGRPDHVAPRRGGGGRDLERPGSPCRRRSPACRHRQSVGSVPQQPSSPWRRTSCCGRSPDGGSPCPPTRPCNPTGD